MGITPTRYFSSEVDPYAIKLSSANFPDIVHIGSVTGVSVHARNGNTLLIANSFREDLPALEQLQIAKDGIDLLIG